MEQAISTMSPLQKLTTEHTEHTERLGFMNERVIFGRWVHVRKISQPYVQ
jgi:hypothetical protein